MSIDKLLLEMNSDLSLQNKFAGARTRGNVRGCFHHWLSGITLILVPPFVLIHGFREKPMIVVLRGVRIYRSPGSNRTTTVSLILNLYLMSFRLNNNPGAMDRAKTL